MKLALFALAACSVHVGTSQPPPAPRGFTTRERAAEPGITGYTFDPALDCVARELGSGHARIRDEIPLACGSPLFPVEGRVVVEREVAATLAAMRTRFLESIPLAVGAARTGDRVAIVMAARLATLEPYQPGDRWIRGSMLVPFAELEAVISTEGGILHRTVERHGVEFAVDVSDLRDADVEIALVDKTHAVGPVVRVRIGAGSTLFPTHGSLLERANAARTRLGLSPLVAARGIDDCKHLPVKIGDVDVTDTAHCTSVPRITEAELADDVTHMPSEQLQLVDPRGAFLQTGMLDSEARFRVLERFEPLAPAAGRARVLVHLQARWPALAEHLAPPEKLAGLLARWAQGDPTKAAPKALVDELRELAAGWTPSPNTYFMFDSARDLDAVLSEIQPSKTPLFADAAFLQVRDGDGAMRHLVAVILATP